MEPLYSGHHWDEILIVLFRGLALSQGLICTAFGTQRSGLYREGCPHVGGGLYEGFHSIVLVRLSYVHLQ